MTEQLTHNGHAHIELINLHTPPHSLQISACMFKGIHGQNFTTFAVNEAALAGRDISSIPLSLQEIAALRSLFTVQFMLVN